MGYKGDVPFPQWRVHLNPGSSPVKPILKHNLFQEGPDGFVLLPVIRASTYWFCRIPQYKLDVDWGLSPVRLILKQNSSSEGPVGLISSPVITLRHVDIIIIPSASYGYQSQVNPRWGRWYLFQEKFPSKCPSNSQIISNRKFSPLFSVKMVFEPLT